jgi:hypothetical protein
MSMRWRWRKRGITKINCLVRPIDFLVWGHAVQKVTLRNKLGGLGDLGYLFWGFMTVFVIYCVFFVENGCGREARSSKLE